MENNTTILSLERYNELYDLEKKTKEGKILAIYERYGYGGRSTDRYYYTDNEIIEQLQKSNEGLTKRIDALENELSRRPPMAVAKQGIPTLDDVRKMSYWEFRKWRQFK